MNNKIIQRLSLLVLALGSFLGAGSAQQNTLVEFHGIYPEEVKASGFVLSQSQEVTVEGLEYKSRKNWWITRSWILDARTRKVMWQSASDEGNRRGRGLQDFKENVSLPQGDYEVYFSAYGPIVWNFNGVGEFLEDLKRKMFDSDDLEEELQKTYFTVRGRGESVSGGALQRFRDQFNQTAIVSMIGLQDKVSRKESFIVEKPIDIEIYALGEIRDDGTFDYGWILNAKTREIIWRLSLSNSTHAGGDRKNRMGHESFTLPTGTYTAIYVTDDSHSNPDWNAAPPFDPEFWGLTIRVKDPSQKKLVKKVSTVEVEEKNVVVNLTRVRNSASLSKGFTLKKPMKLHIYALGEGQKGKMYDYGWIVDAATQKPIWRMEYDRTTDGGGANKNRLIDDVVRFEKGNYLVYYTTDDSHSYENWNSGPPYDPDHWGITITAVDDDFRPSDVSSYEEREDPNVLVQLVNMEDWERAREKFILQKESEIRVYAIGEGSSGEMYDYGWIEEARTGKTVWEMTYRRSSHAGGAKKNMMIDEVITLKPGEYVVRYVSDGSHSFEEWNDAPPYDVAHWGISVYRVGKK